MIEWVRSAYYPNYDSRVLDYNQMICAYYVFFISLWGLDLLGERILRRKKGYNMIQLCWNNIYKTYYSKAFVKTIFQRIEF